MYARYIDDIFITINNNEDITRLITALENNSVLKFTSENSDNGRLPFLDIDITKQANKFKATVYTKPTNVGRCLKGIVYGKIAKKFYSLFEVLKLYRIKICINIYMVPRGINS